MAYRNFDRDFGDLTQNGPAQDDASSNNSTILQADGQNVDLPDASFVRDAEITRDGVDLVLDGPDGVIVIEGYFAAEPAPHLIAPDGSTLTPELVESFTTSPQQYASNSSLNDESPVGDVQEVSGESTVTHIDGSVEKITIGTKIFQGDIVDTSADGAVNIVFIDETSFAVSEDARLAIDEYVFDPGTGAGSSNFSVLKGIFVFTSGLIGRDDPDAVEIDTPVGSIGIRGTIIAGDVDAGEITVVEGAIVLRDFHGNEMTLAGQFETARFDIQDSTIVHMENLSANDISSKFSSVSDVAPGLFSSINDAAHEQTTDQGSQIDSIGDDAVNNARPDGTALDGAAVDTGEPETSLSTQHVNEAAVDEAAVNGAAQIQQQIKGAALIKYLIHNNFGAGDGGFGLLAGIGNGNLPATDGTTATTAATDSTTTTTNTTPAIDPNALPSTQPNAAPMHFRTTPNAYLTSAEGMGWGHNFHADFWDPDGVAASKALTFQLSLGTINTLNSLQVGGSSGLDVLQSGTGWTFNTSTGNIELLFNGGFNTTPGTVTPIDINVRAIDIHGATSGFSTYNFKAFNPDINPTDFSQTGKILANYTINTTGVSITGSSNNIFMESGNDVDINLTGSNNYINMGEGANSIIIGTGASGNTIVGGGGNDTFNISNTNVTIFGMGGDDDFIFNMTASMSTALETAPATGANLAINGKYSDFRAFENLSAGLAASGDPLALEYTMHNPQNGRGDSIVVQGTPPLDFSLINAAHKIHGIERIDMIANLNANTVKLSLNDVVTITDWKNALVINLSANDTLNINVAGLGMTQIATAGTDGGTNNNNLASFSLDDASEGGAANVLGYDVYTGLASGGETVTLFIHNGGGTVSGVAPIFP